MRYIILFLLSIGFIGCTSSSLENAIDNSMVAMSGNKPPKFFKVANFQTMKDYIFDMKDYTIAMPSAKKEDFSIFNGWQGLTHYDKEITLYLGTEAVGYPYHITVSSSKIKKCGKQEKAIENEDIKYIRSKIKIDNDDKLFITHFGKEKYKCAVMEYTRKNYPQNRYIGYNCYKFNEDNTLYKKVHIRITYTKVPTLPEKYKDLAKEYTYEDLQKRVKRMLDSLYIKADWDE